MLDFCTNQRSNHMKDLIVSALFLTLIPGKLAAQNTCDSVVIDMIRYSAVDTGIIEVMAYVTSNDCISYPSFILYDQNGDTLAAEVTDFFCLGFGSAQTHRLIVREGVQLDDLPFAASLELFSGFGDILVCSWNFPSLELCPPAPCIQAEIYLTNTGDLEPFSTYWWVTDTSGTWIESGYFDMDSVHHTGFDTLCLPPGTYLLSFTPFSPIDSNYVIGITTSYQQSIGTNNHLHPQPSPLDLRFTWYAQCVDATNSVAELDRGSVRIQQYTDQLEIMTNDGSAIGTLELFTVDGRMARSLKSKNDRSSLNVADLSNRVILVRIIRPSGISFTQRVFIP